MEINNDPSWYLSLCMWNCPCFTAHRLKTLDRHFLNCNESKEPRIMSLWLPIALRPRLNVSFYFLLTCSSCPRLSSSTSCILTCLLLFHLKSNLQIISLFKPFINCCSSFAESLRRIKSYIYLSNHSKANLLFLFYNSFFFSFHFIKASCAMASPCPTAFLIWNLFVSAWIITVVVPLFIFQYSTVRRDLRSLCGFV